MSGYIPIAEEGAQPKAVSRRDAGRIELTAVTGMRFFATACLVMGRAIETLWIDEGKEGRLFSHTICSGLHTLAKDVVSFYYILSGFTMCWGYLSRDMDTSDVRWRYWTRRFARFYPDFFLSTVVTFLLKLPYFFGCHDYGWPSWVSNATSLLLFSAWYRFVPGSGYINGPVWFIVTLFWLWVFFPYLLKPVKMMFGNCGWGDFLAKLALLWVISMLPWSVIDEDNLQYLRWGLRCFPLLRIPEFVIGMAIALRVNKDKQEMDEQEAQGVQPSFRPQMVAGVGPIICLILTGSYYIWKVSIWPDDCECLPGDSGERFYHCFGWWEKFDTKFAPIAALMIYSVTTLDVAAHTEGEKTSYDAAVPRVGHVGASVWWFLCLPPFVKLGSWGLPIFLWQCLTNLITEVILIDLGWGLPTRCGGHNLQFSFEYAGFYWGFHVFMAYVVAWIMNEDGFIGSIIHNAVKKITPD